MFISLDFESNIPIYEQLKNAIIIGIAKNELSPGERLPSVRRLASDIGINLHTVNKAYQQLQDDGLVIIHRQKGVIIHPELPKTADDDYITQLIKTMKPIVAHAHVHQVDEKQFTTFIQQLYEQLNGGDSNE